MSQRIGTSRRFRVERAKLRETTSRIRIFTVTSWMALLFVPQGAEAGPRAACTGEEATIVGTPGRDVIEATDEQDVIVTKGGDDSITGVAGRDLVCAGPGDDRISDGNRGYRYRVLAGRGTDRVRMGNGQARGGMGADVLVVGGGRAFGGRGDDNLNAKNGSVYGGPGDDRARAAGRVDGGPGDDVLTATPDCAPLMVPGSGDDVMTGGTGSCLDDEADSSYMELLGAPRGVWLNVEKGVLWGWGRDRFVGFKYFTGSRYNDVLIGSQASDWFDGAGGADVVVGGAGPDVLEGDDAYPPEVEEWGLAGPDVVRGGPGDDHVEGNEGADRLFGGNGTDELNGGVVPTSSMEEPASRTWSNSTRMAMT